MMQVVDEQERKTTQYLDKATELRDKWKKIVYDAKEDAEKLCQEAIRPWKIIFDSPTDHLPLATPKDNIKKAAELLGKNDEEIDIGHLRTLVATTMKQQSKANTLHRLESNPEVCVSNTQKNASGRERRDEQSRTGSTECRRPTREHPNLIPIRSDTPLAWKNKGNDLKYTGRDKYRNPSPTPRNHRPPPPPRRRSPAGNPIPHGPGGINIRDNVKP
jgi:hypothetical protein